MHIRTSLLALMLLLLMVPALSFAQGEQQKTYCNPVNIDYG